MNSNRSNTSTTLNLNLARKWRSQQFTTIIGQELVVRILKNSLYARIFFPVYLFSGKQGCGKTTTARVFAAAINCEELSIFQKEPKKYEIPCLRCASCQLMVKGKHPDFIEKDAASHTGVDHVRDIIDAAALLPVMGRKKIYLIDEAHMLSKAAFNAFLKILEEPPSSVLFILATTEAHKVIETVRSRCFQLFFQPVDCMQIVDHLGNVCEKEDIVYEQEGLQLIAEESAGSVRDALNLIERVRFSDEKISKDAVYKVLRFVDVNFLIDLLSYVCACDRKALIFAFNKVSFDQFCLATIWKNCIEIIQVILWLKHEVPCTKLTQYEEHLKELAARGSIERFIMMLEKFYEYEQIFFKTSSQSSLIQMIFLALCGVQEEPSQSSQIQSRYSALEDSPRSIHDDHKDGYTKETVQDKGELINDVCRNTPKEWAMFIEQIDQRLDDPLISSVFKQARFVHFDKEQRVIVLAFAKRLSFFNDMLHSTEKYWLPILHAIFGTDITCRPEFVDEDGQLRPFQLQKTKAKSFNVQVKKNQEHTSSFRPQQAHQLRNGKNARILLEFFPGSLSLMGPYHE